MHDAVIAGFVRTPFHFANKGALTNVRPDDLAAIALTGLIDKTGIDPAVIEDFVLGCAYPEAEQGNNIARIAVLLAQLPVSVAGMTVNRFCGSSMSAIHISAGQIGIGAGEVFVCGGVESMTKVPQGGFNFSANPRFQYKDMPPAELMTEAYIAMGDTAENVAAKYGISRADQEKLAYALQMKAAAAQAAGRFKGEIVPVMTEHGWINTDG